MAPFYEIPDQCRHRMCPRKLERSQGVLKCFSGKARRGVNKNNMIVCGDKEVVDEMDIDQYDIVNFTDQGKV